MPASNHTFLTRLGDEGVQCVYKPSSGERPLWDFTDGTLADREYAAWVISDHLGWDVVPPTVLRDGPAGPGMVQLWMEPDETAEDGPDPVDVVPEGSCRRATCTSSTRPAPTTSRSPSCTRTPSRCAGWPSSTSSPTTPTARAGTCCRCRTATATGSTTASASTPRTSSARCCGAGPGQRLTTAERAGVQGVLDGLRRRPRRSARGPAHRARGGRDRAALRAAAAGRTVPDPRGRLAVDPVAALLRAGR